MIESFPHIAYAPAGGAEPHNWIAENRDRLLREVESVGAVLLRQFALSTDQDFDAAIRQFELPAFTYEESLSNAVRMNRTDRVFTANEAPPEIEIFLHHEMAQTPLYPSKLFFFCEKAATNGGATPLCRSDLLWSEMEREMPRFADDCREKGVKYTNVMPPAADANSGQGRSWKSTLSCETPEAAESRLAELNYDWSWQDDGSLRVTTPVLPAVRELPSGTEVFFNQLIAAFMGWKDSRNLGEKSVRFGDGSEIADTDMEQVVTLSKQFTYDLQWQDGDMAVVDNFLVMHGRRPFAGERRVLASLAA
ncbi:MAG: TauD/TfdA family dioxygenase [Pseudomonadales bacterium]|nr:TauD/TfdA family dioxygenase [Pseudomonadales bacterium]